MKSIIAATNKKKTPFTVPVGLNRGYSLPLTWFCCARLVLQIIIHRFFLLFLPVQPVFFPNLNHTDAHIPVNGFVTPSFTPPWRSDVSFVRCYQFFLALN